MQIVQGNRGTGKTTELIKKCANDPNGILVVANIHQVYYTQHLARNMGLQIMEPITFQQVIDGKALRGRLVHLYIDNADVFLRQIVNGTSIFAISILGENTSED